MEFIPKIYFWNGAFSPRTNHLLKSFSYKGAEVWNSLSQDLHSAASSNEFKRRLRYHSFEWDTEPHDMIGFFLFY